MSIKNHFSGKIVSLGNPQRWLFVPLAITLISLAIAQDPPSPPPLAGGFRIDFGDGAPASGVQVSGVQVSGGNAGVSVPAVVPAEETGAERAAVGREILDSDEVLRTFAGSQAADDQTGSGVASNAKPNGGKPQKAVANPPAGLPTDALPIAFPAAGAQNGPNKGPATLVHAGEMIGFSRDLGDGVQAITIINASRRWMAVYHIDSSGQIRLTSSRPLDADFTIQFNAAAPLPDDIRRLQGK